MFVFTVCIYKFESHEKLVKPNKKLINGQYSTTVINKYINNNSFDMADSFARTNPELQTPPSVSQTPPALQQTNSNPAESANEEHATPSQNTNPPQLPIEDPLNPSFPSLPWIEEPMFTTQTAALVRNAIRKEGLDNTKLAYNP